jgi:hypothetical protein
MAPAVCGHPKDAASSGFTYCRGVANLRYPADATLDHSPSRVAGWEASWGLNASTVFKRSVLCLHCNEEYLFTLRAIADSPEFRNHQ